MYQENSANFVIAAIVFVAVGIIAQVIVTTHKIKSNKKGPGVNEQSILNATMAEAQAHSVGQSYSLHNLLNDREIKALNNIKAHLDSQNGELVVIPKVNLNDIVDDSSSNNFNRLPYKADFVLFDKNYSPTIIICLRSPNNNDYDNKQRINNIKQICQSTNIKFIELSDDEARNPDGNVVL